MRNELVEKSGYVDVPKGTGVEGFIRTVREILKLPRVQGVEITRGRVVYKQLLRPSDAMEPLEIDFETLMPSGIIRNAEVVEQLVGEDDAAICVAKLFRRITFDRLLPICFVTGSSTILWKWFQDTTGIELPTTDEFFGLPVLSDNYYENDHLLLCAGPSRGSTLIDTQRAYKLLIPRAS